VALEQRVAHPPGRDATTVVCDFERHTLAFALDAQPHFAGLCVLGRVPNQFPSQREQHVRLREPLVWIDLDDDAQGAVVTVTPGDLLERSAKSDVVEDVGMQIEDLLAQLGDGDVDRLVDAREALGISAPLCAAKVVARRDQVLHG